MVNQLLREHGFWFALIGGLLVAPFFFGVFLSNLLWFLSSMLEWLKVWDDCYILEL